MKSKLVCSFCVLFLLHALSGHSVGQVATYDPEQSQQFMRDWLVLGPVVTHESDESDDTRQQGFEADQLEAVGGEAQVNPQVGDKVKIEGQELAWRRVTSDDEAVDLAKALDEHDWSIAYASATLQTPSETRAVLAIGSDDAVRVWLNGELVQDNWAGRPLTLDEDIVPVTLAAGANRLLLKIYNAQLDWGFSSRLLSPAELANQLVKATSRREEERIRDLLAAGADINAKDKHGITALQTARVRGHGKLARMLEVLGATDSDFDPSAVLASVLGSAAKPDRPGIAVLVSHGGDVVFSHGFGLASMEHDVPVTLDTKFRIGSVTKQFTAAAILKLQEAGKLSVEDKLDKFFSDYPRGNEVTIHHLLTHTSGIASFTSKPSFYATVASSVTPGELIDSFKDDPFDFEPGEKFSYCNSGYFLLGEIVAQVSGMPFGDYLKTTFFEPLGMNDTGVHASTLVLKHEATGYAHSAEDVTKALDWDMSRAGGAGNLYSTVNDLQKWNEAVFSGEVLSEEALRAAMTTNEVKSEGEMSLPYGYGWMMDEHRGLKRIGHSGGLQGFVSYLARYPEQDLTVVALHNAMPQMPGLSPNQVCDHMAEAFLWKEMKERPKYEVAKDVDPATYDDYVGHYDYNSAIMEITRDGDKLMAQLTGQPKLQIFPEGNDKFFWKVVDAQVEFIRDGSGKVTGARHTQGIAKFVAPRVGEQTEVEVAAEILDRYVGKYSYQGLGELTVRREGNQLLAKMTGQPEFQLHAASETTFFWKVVNAQIDFRLEDGKVTGATHHQGGHDIDAKKIK